MQRAPFHSPGDAPRHGDALQGEDRRTVAASRVRSDAAGEGANAGAPSPGRSGTQQPAAGGASPFNPGRWPALAGLALIRVYQLSLSGFLGRQCRYMPSCSAYTMETIGRFGLWRGGWMGLARICRCHPWGSHGLDFPPHRLPEGARWFTPWRYGRWRGVQAEPDEAQRPHFRCD